MTKFCMQSIKEHNLKANHNKQSDDVKALLLYAIYQRTQSESKSQRELPRISNRGLCMQSIKEHNLKANHNTRRMFELFYNLYAIYQRTQSESKSQLLVKALSNRMVCMQSIKEHNLKANHNRTATEAFNSTSVCNLSKNTI